jgi:hypothetical protein
MIHSRIYHHRKAIDSKVREENRLGSCRQVDKFGVAPWRCGVDDFGTFVARFVEGSSAFGGFERVAP